MASLVELAEYLEASNVSEFYSIKVVGGLLKVCPRDVHTNVLLEIDESCPDPDNMFWILNAEYFVPKLRIYKHRTPALTKEFKRRVITPQWVCDFMKEHASQSRALTESRRLSPLPERTPNFGIYRIPESGRRY